MRVMRLARRGAPALVLALAVGGSAFAADIGAIGFGFKLKESATKKTLSIVSKDASITLPASDPAALGATLDVTIESASGTKVESFVLDAGGWAKSSATAKKFKGTVPGIKAVQVKAGQLKIKGEPSLLDLSSAPYTAGKVVLAIGADRYCVDFTTPADVNTFLQLKWKTQTSAAVCPAAPTTTTTSTSSTTVTVPPTCGNGVLEPGEACDDDNNVDCDGCDSNCTTSDTCGNGITCDPEQCDGGPACNGSCESTAQTCVGVTGQRLVIVSIDTPQPLAGVRIDLAYPFVQTSLPGSGGSSEVQSRVFVFPTGGITAVNDRDSDMTMVFANTSPFVGSGPAFAVNFDECTDLSKTICNRAPTVTDCCSNPGDPNQFGDLCSRYSPSLSCTEDADCPGPDNATCTGAGTPYPCCTGAGTGTCNPSSFCTANGTPLGCCTGLGTGTCPGPNGSCVFKCPANPPVCAPGHFPTDPTTQADGPCDNVPGACPGDNVCISQQSVTNCSVASPTDANGNPVAGVTCSVTIL